MKVLGDSYIENTWRSQLNHEFGEFYEKKFGEVKPYSYAVNLGLPSHVSEKYNLSSSYQEIFEKEHSEITQIVFMNQVHDPFADIDGETQKLYDLIMYLKNKDLFSFTIRVTYNEESLQKAISKEDKQLNYFDFNDKYVSEAVCFFLMSIPQRTQLP